MNIKQAKKEITQSRSKYQIEKFVLGQHHSQEMQYLQLVIEADGLMNSIKEMELQITIETLEINVIGNKRELSYMEELFEAYPKFTRDEIEDAQKSYWETRLMRTAQFQMLARQGGVDWAQLEALQQANVIEQSFSVIPSFNYMTDEHKTLQIGEKND